MRTLIKAEAAFHFQSTIPSYWILAYLVGEQEIVCQLCTLLILMKISYIFQLFCFLSLWNSYPGFVQWLFEISVPKHILILKLPRRIFCFVLPEDISNCQYLCSKKDFFASCQFAKIPTRKWLRLDCAFWPMLNQKRANFFSNFRSLLS